MEFLAIDEDDDWTLDHIAHRGIGMEDLQDVIFYKPRVTSNLGGGRYLILGTTRSGRHLAVFADDQGGGSCFVVTARDMTSRERKSFNAKKGGS